MDLMNLAGMTQYQKVKGGLWFFKILNRSLEGSFVG